MKKRITRNIEIPLSAEGVETAYTFIEEGLKRNHISREILSETMLVFEALFHNLIEQHVDQSLVLTVTTQRTIGEIYIKLGYEGKPYIPIENDPNDLSPEASILRAFNEKIAYRYSAGFNSIRIVVRRSYSGFQMRCLAGVALAIGRIPNSV